MDVTYPIHFTNGLVIPPPVLFKVNLSYMLRSFYRTAYVLTHQHGNENRHIKLAGDGNNNA